TTRSRACSIAPASRTRCNRRSGARSRAARPSRCCASTSTGSRTSTRRWARAAATTCCAAPPCACARRSAAWTWAPAWAATIARDLRQALYDGDLHLHFQPLFERDGRTLGGYEALVRWTHPQRGPIGPAEFIPIAEESDLIDDLGLWVLAQACAEAATWPASL